METNRESPRTTAQRPRSFSDPGPRLGAGSELRQQREQAAKSLQAPGGMEQHKPTPGQLSPMDGGKKGSGKAGFLSRMKQAGKALAGIAMDPFGIQRSLHGMAKAQGHGDHPALQHTGLSGIFTGLKMANAALAEAKKGKPTELSPKGGDGDQGGVQGGGEHSLSPMIQIRFGHHADGDNKGGGQGGDGDHSAGKSPFGFPQITISGPGGQDGKPQSHVIDFSKMLGGGGPDGDKGGGGQGGIKGFSINFAAMAKGAGGDADQAGGGGHRGLSSTLDFRKMAAGQAGQGGQDGQGGGPGGGPGKGFAISFSFGAHQQPGGAGGGGGGGGQPPPTTRPRSNAITSSSAPKPGSSGGGGTGK